MEVIELDSEVVTGPNSPKSSICELRVNLYYRLSSLVKDRSLIIFLISELCIVGKFHANLKTALQLCLYILKLSRLDWLFLLLSQLVKY